MKVTCLIKPYAPFFTGFCFKSLGSAQDTARPWQPYYIRAPDQHLDLFKN